MRPGQSDQAARLRARVGLRGCRVITITSGKGGVGKTALTANLGLELAKTGKKVLLLDGDLGLANLAIVFNLAPRWDLGDVLDGRCALADVVLNVNENLKLIPAAAGAAVLAELPEAKRQALLADILALGAQTDFLLIDTGAGISPTVIGLIAIADRSMIVTTHEPTALSDAYGLIKAARVKCAADLELVVNMANSHVQARDTHARLSRLTERFLGFNPPLVAVIPADECVGQAIIRQQPMSLIYPYSPATRSIAGLAKLLTSRTGANHDRSSISLAVPVRR